MKFAEVIGQESLKKQLIQTIKENRVSHALLFAGPEGSGNLALALAYAQYLTARTRRTTIPVAFVKAARNIQSLFIPICILFFL
jgi:DNA polymerase-3 subunit delta'